MTKKRSPSKTYPVEFKLEAMRMMEESDRPAAEITRELGISGGRIPITQQYQLVAINTYTAPGILANANPPLG